MPIPFRSRVLDRLTWNQAWSSLRDSKVLVCLYVGSRVPYSSDIEALLKDDDIGESILGN